MGFFAQRRWKGHVKANSSQAIQDSYNQAVDLQARPKTAPTQHSYVVKDPPQMPPRPHRADAIYSFPPPPPQWDQSKTSDKYIDSEKWVASQLQSNKKSSPQAPPALSQHPAFRQNGVDSRDAYNVVSDKLSEIISMIDEDAYVGSDRDFIITLPSPTLSNEDVTPTPATADSEKTLVNFTIPQSRFRSKSTTYQGPTRQERTVNFLSKVSYYSNSRLPMNLPALRVYIPTWPLFCLAAQYSSTAYSTPTSSDWSDRSTCYIPSNPSTGTKAMVIKSVPCDSKKTIVFAIRGTSVLSLRDWNTNLNTTPTAPDDFLDDSGNLCHAGFLRVARAMIVPIAMRLRQLLQQNPSRSECSLLITGHSAGGAVASLLYAHMLSQTVTSELTILTSCFKRVHCITFGAPPVTLLPLKKPDNAADRLQKCLFHSFINEGDPVVRAEKSYIRSLVDLVTTQLPTKENLKTMGMIANGLNKLDLSMIPTAVGVVDSSKTKLKQMTSRPALHNMFNQKMQDSTSSPPKSPDNNVLQMSPSPKNRPAWILPPSTLSNAGRLVVLRVAPLEPTTTAAGIKSPSQMTSTTLRHEFDTVRAEIVTDEVLRNTVFGDPLMHGMDVYRRRVEALAMKAVTGRGSVSYS